MKKEHNNPGYIRGGRSKALWNGALSSIARAFCGYLYNTETITQAYILREICTSIKWSWNGLM